MALAYPPNFLTPKRLDSESRPFLVEPPAFLDAHRRGIVCIGSGILHADDTLITERCASGLLPNTRAIPIAAAIAMLPRAVSCFPTTTQMHTKQRFGPVHMNRDFWSEPYFTLLTRKRYTCNMTLHHAVGSASCNVSDAQLREIVVNALKAVEAQRGAKLTRVAIVPPDFTRFHS